MKAALNRWFDTLAPFLALGGLAGSLVPDYLNVRTWEVPATDFKTLFAAVRLFAQNHDPYSVSLLHNVFRSDGVIEPHNWFGHMPVYPPFTLAILRPLAGFNMATASWIWFVLSAVLMALALVAMLRYAHEELSLTLPWRIALLAVCVACPLVAFALEIGNVSTATAALAMLAFFLRGNPIVRGVLLALALLLKPHLALWLLIAMLATPARKARATALYAIVISGFFVIFSSMWLMVQGTLGTIWHSYRAMLHAESIASMSAGSHELLPIGAQITSVWSLAEYFSASLWMKLLAATVLLLCVAAIAWSMREMQEEENALPLPIAAACVAFGMIATYHRAHDAQLLLLVMPVLFAWLRNRDHASISNAHQSIDGSQKSNSLRILSIGMVLMFLGTWFSLPGASEFLQLRQASLFAIFFAFFVVNLSVFSLKMQKKGRYKR